MPLNPNRHIVGADGTFITSIGDSKRNPEADARLIAAAPEMLEALISWLQFWDSMPRGQLGRIVCNLDFFNEAFLKTTFAIAKAGGKS